MPTIVCPTCGERLDVPPELAASAVRCGACESVIDPPAPPPRSESTGLPRARRVSASRLDDDLPPRKTGSRLWLLAALGLIGFSCAGCCGVIAFVGWKMEHPTWARFSPPDGAFAVEFPGGPPKQTSQLLHAGRWPATMTTYSVEREFANEGYLVAHYDLHPGFDPDDEDDVEAELNAGLDNLKAMPGGRFRETGRTAITFCGGTGKEAVGTFTSMNGNHGRATARVVVVDKRLYVLFAHAHGEGPAVAKMDRFFGSFTPVLKK